jgi:hypothetical protein
MALGLMRHGPFDRRTLVAFALVSAVVNGIVTAGVGAWLAQSYARYQSRAASVEGISKLFYGRRTRGGMVVSSLRRNAPLDELRERKRAYDEIYVEWNTSIRKNLFVIREVMGRREFAKLEQRFEDDIVAPLSHIDACLTKAYDVRLAGGEPMPVLSDCRMNEYYQFVLDCGATYTNELYKLSRLSLLPFGGVTDEERSAAEARIDRGCNRMDLEGQPPAPAAGGSTAPASTGSVPTTAPPSALRQ